MDFKKICRNVAFKLDKNSPKIMIASGLIGFGVTVVLACKETLKVSDILTEYRKDMDSIKKLEADETKEYPVKEKKRDVLITKAKFAGKLALNYAPAMATAGLSTALILKSNGIMTDRYAKLSAGYAALDSAFNKYRKNVIEKLGEEDDKKLYFGYDDGEIEVTEIDEKGKEKKKKEKVKVVDAEAIDDYTTLVFKPGDNFYDNNDLMFESALNAQQEYINRLILSGKHLTINYIRKVMFDKSESKVGMIWGYAEEFGDGMIQLKAEKAYETDTETGAYRKVFIVELPKPRNLYESFK